MSAKKILIIDDDRDLVRGLSVRLKANSYIVVSAMDAVTAMTVMRKESPDLVLLDLGLPGGSGLTVLERMKSSTGLPNIPVIVLSARDPAGHKENALKAGAALFLQKPADNHVLLAAIRETLGEGGTASSAQGTA